MFSFIVQWVAGSLLGRLVKGRPKTFTIIAAVVLMAGTGYAIMWAYNNGKTAAMAEQYRQEIEELADRLSNYAEAAERAEARYRALDRLLARADAERRDVDERLREINERISELDLEEEDRRCMRRRIPGAVVEQLQPER